MTTISQQEREEWRARHFPTADPLYWGIVGVADRFLDALEETETRLRAAEEVVSEARKYQHLEGHQLLRNVLRVYDDTLDKEEA